MGNLKDEYFWPDGQQHKKKKKGRLLINANPSSLDTGLQMTVYMHTFSY